MIKKFKAFTAHDLVKLFEHTGLKNPMVLEVASDIKIGTVKEFQRKIENNETAIMSLEDTYRVAHAYTSFCVSIGIISLEDFKTLGEHVNNETPSVDTQDTQDMDEVTPSIHINDLRLLLLHSSPLLESYSDIPIEETLHRTNVSDFVLIEIATGLGYDILEDVE